MPRLRYCACATIRLFLAGNTLAQAPGAKEWNPKAAASYRDQRFIWCMNWPKPARDHGTLRISCPTAAPYGLGRPALRRVLAEQSPSPVEQKLLDNVIKRVRMWKEA